MTRACAIPLSVKEAVWERDGGCCVLCGVPVDRSLANAHFIPRSHGGLGVKENILTLCPSCHMRFDQSGDRNEIKKILKEYLKEQYRGWNEDELRYRKYEKGCRYD